MFRSCFFTSLLIVIGCLNGYAQKKTIIPVIITVNDELHFPITLMQLRAEKAGFEKGVDAGYSPGRLIVNESDTSLILHATTVTISFYYNKFISERQFTKNLKATFSPNLFKQPYLIINFYAFSDKKYKHWYKTQSNQEFAVDFDYPGSGRLIRRR